MRRTWIALATTVVLAACAACGGGGGTGRSGGRPVLGSTDQVAGLDPAGSYDQGSWLLYANTFQTLLTIPPGADEPVPEAATSCGTDATRTAYTCVVREGLEFSNGDPLTAEDVAFSFNRIRRINAPEGPAPLFRGIASVASSGRKVTFHLTAPDSTFPMKLTTGAASIVDHRVYPADRLLTGNRLVGSGVYSIRTYEPKVRVELAPNGHYEGKAERENDGATIRYYPTADRLAIALKRKEVDFVARGLPPVTENAYANGFGNYRTIEASSPMIRLLVLDTTHAPFSDPAVRRAVAELVDRQALARDVYRRTVQPLYSLIPQGLSGHTSAFFDRYGASPDIRKAADVLEAAGVSTPVPLTLTVSSGAAAVPEGNELRDQLEDGGLFSVTVRHMDWKPFVDGWAANRYDAFTIGWSADYPDPDDYVGPILTEDNVFHNGYHDAAVDSLLSRSRTVTDRSSTDELFSRIQGLEAADAPILPLWQGKDYAVNAPEVHGSSLATNASGITCLWMISVAGA